jgi:hypothetical protein
MIAHQAEDSGWRKIDFVEIFGTGSAAGLDQLHRYFAKALGCRLVAFGGVLPPEFFPNPITGDKMERLKVSICRAQPFRGLLPDYDPGGWDRIMSKGPLHSSHSKIGFEATGQRHVLSVVWNYGDTILISHPSDRPRQLRIVSQQCHGIKAK